MEVGECLSSQKRAIGLNGLLSVRCCQIREEHDSIRRVPFSFFFWWYVSLITRGYRCYFVHFLKLIQMLLWIDGTEWCETVYDSFIIIISWVHRSFLLITLVDGLSYLVTVEPLICFFRIMPIHPISIARDDYFDPLVVRYWKNNSQIFSPRLDLVCKFDLPDDSLFGSLAYVISLKIVSSRVRPVTNEYFCSICFGQPCVCESSSLASRPDPYLLSWLVSPSFNFWNHLRTDLLFEVFIHKLTDWYVVLAGKFNYEKASKFRTLPNDAEKILLSDLTKSAESG